MKIYMIVLTPLLCCAAERPAHYPHPKPHPTVVAAHQAAQSKQEESQKRKSLFTPPWKKQSLKK